MSQFLPSTTMSFNTLISCYRPLKVLFLAISMLLLYGCTTAAQDRTENSLRELEAQQSGSKPYLGGYNPTDPPRLSADAGYDPLNPELSDTVAVPFLSFLIIEPDPITRNAVPPDVERLIKARKYQDAINLINSQIKENPRNVQIRFIKARLQIELRQWDAAKKTLIEITQQFPELPEPYNNLAALAANQGNWIEARDYLELALKIRPSYAIASANLGEIYIRLGAQAYTNAARGTQLNPRQYTNRAKALLDILKPPKRTRPAPAATTVNPEQSTNPSESRSKNGESSPKN
jgi:tetratricopeptide (TPR) repeat protein